MLLRGPHLVRPVEGLRPLTLLGEGLVFVSEVMAAGGGVSVPPPPFTSAGDRCPSPCPGIGCRLVTREGERRPFSVPVGWGLEVAGEGCLCPLPERGRCC